MSQQMLLPLSLLGALAATASLVTILKIALDRPRLASCRRWVSPQSTSMIRSAERSPHCMQHKQADKHRRAVPAEAERTDVAADVERTQNPKVRGAPL
jgi:hypothetical protein